MKNSELKGTSADLYREQEISDKFASDIKSSSSPGPPTHNASQRTFSNLPKEVLASPGNYSEPEILNRSAPNKDLLSTSENASFGVKITDLTRIDNPFIILENRKVNLDGYLMIDEIQKTGLPWLSESSINQKLTLKIEVSLMGKLVLIRFLHLDKFFSMEYPKIALRIAHNTI